MKLSTLFSVAIMAGLITASAHAATRCDDTYEKLDAYAGSKADLGSCSGYMWVDRISANSVKLHISNSKCSNVRIVQDSGFAWEGIDKLDTSSRPYKGDMILVGHYFAPDKAELEFSSNSCNTKVRVFVHY